MPEGDTIEALAGRIRHQFAGAAVERSVGRDPRLPRLDLSGTRLVDAVAVGKHLLLRFDNGETLHSHLRMDGRWQIGGASKLPEWRRRVEIWFERGRLTGIDLPMVGLVKTTDEQTVVGFLGPDLCGPQPPDPDVVAARLVAEPSEPLAGALLDQRRVAGFGNVFAVEVPYLCGVSPFQPVGAVDGLASLVRLGTALIRHSMGDARRTTTGRRGASFWVYGKGGGRCPQCGTALRSRRGSDTPWGRDTVWCPVCQPERSEPVAVDLRRARQLLALHPARRAAFDD